MRLHRTRSVFLLLLCLAAGIASAQPIVTLSTNNNNLLGGQTATLQALVTNATNKAVTWSVDVAVPNAILTPVSGPDPTGFSTANYKAPALISSKQTVVVTARSVENPSEAASVQITLTPTAITVSVTPPNSTPAPGQQVTFTAFVSGTSQTAVTWTLSSGAQGSISPSGNTCIYSAPNPIASSQSVKLTATLNSDQQTSGSATITLAPVGVTISPTTASLTGGGSQTFTATVTGGSGGVTWSITSSPVLGGLSVNGNQATYNAPPPGTFANNAKVTITATSADDNSKSASATVTLTATGVTISPTTATLSTGATQQFTATVSGATNTAVTWTINPQIGSIDQTGLYTAPATVTTGTKVTVTATSQADATKSASASVTINSVIDVGSGAPTQALVTQFINAYYRNGFNNLVGLPPLGLVKTLGTTAGYYVQEFPDAAKTSGVRYALASASATVTAAPSPDGTTNASIVQIYGPEYAYYLTVGAATAGYPLSDTIPCPSFDPSNSCMFLSYDKGYTLFVYSAPLLSGATTFTVRQGINTEWLTLGGVNGIGRPVTAETAVTATKIAPNTAGTTATAQTFSGGAIYSITSNSFRGQVHGVTEPIYDLYISSGGPTGPLGLPTSEVLVNTVTGLRKQTFEGGVLQYTPTGGPTQQLPVVAVNVSGATPGSTVTLNVGQSLTLSAAPVDSLGDILTDRPISWSSTNGQVVSIAPQPNSQSAVITAIGGGSAGVTAASGGVTSAKITIVVTAPCCQVGDGAPLPVQSAFQNALTRNQISIQLPVAAPAIRQGNGYVQMVQSSSGGSSTAYLLAQSDDLGSAYVVTGLLLAQYQTMGGPSGALGYPISDASAGGTQRFFNGALAGSPVRLVTGPILTKWGLLGYETGAAGAPTGDITSFSTFGANSGASQSFANGAIYAATAGPRSGQTYFVSGLILATYTTAGGASGDLGMPTGDEFVTAGVHQQSFEGGSISYSPGAGTAQIQAAPKVPAVIVAPGTISAGARARLAISGFPNGATMRVSITGQPDFLVTSANGAYAWEMFIAAATASGTLTIRAADTKGSATASGTLTIQGFDSNRVQMTAVRGNNQTGAPGAMLPVPLQVALKDASGAPVVGVAVSFQPSLGAQVTVPSTVTDANGLASTYVRLPNSAGVSGVAASSAVAQSAVSFYAVASGASIANFPSVTMNGSAVMGSGPATIGQKGALLSAIAGILRYQQNRGAAGSPNGLADAPTLNQFLTTYCGADANANRVCDGFLSNSDSGEQVVNLWRAAQFTGGIDVTALSPTIAAVADLVTQGEPVLLSLSLSLNGSPAGGHFVVASGVADDGSILIQDPNPLFARASLSEYGSSFTAGGGTWKGTLIGAARFAVRSPSATRFLLGEISQPAALVNGMSLDIGSPSGACGIPLQMLDTVDASGNAPAKGALVSKLQVCDGSQAAYQIGVGAAQPYHAFATDLASGGGTFDLSGSVPSTYQASRPLLNLSITPQAASFTANGVVNAATFTAGIAPGGIFSIFGSGLAGAGGATAVDFDGSAAAVLSASTFQVNAVVPADLTAGTHTLRVKSPYGTAQQQVTISAVAPAIFLVGDPPVGAVENQDGSLNGTANPSPRGQVMVVFATGLGAVTRQGQFSRVNVPVTAVVNGVELPVSFAGLTPQFAGLYQVNIPIPTTTAPGLGISLTLKQGGQLSNAVTVALQ